MTCGIGTKSIPKDYKFENILRTNLTPEKFDKIIYYDTCIIAKQHKHYGKIVISDDSIYSYVEKGKIFSILSNFKNIVSIDLITDVPQFFFGPLRDNCVHIRLTFYKSNHTTENHNSNEKTSISHPLCCTKAVKTSNLESTKPLLLSNTAYSEINPTATSDKHEEVAHVTINEFKTPINEISVDLADLYILNKYSPIMAILKKAYVDYLIRNTLEFSLLPNVTNNRLTHSLINHLFDGLIKDISKTINSVNIHKEFLLELIESGHKYTRIKILFWSKSDLFDFMVEQFVGRSQTLLLMDSGDLSLETQSSGSVKTLLGSCLDCLNVLLQVFNIFFSQTDHLHTKWEHLRKDNAKLSISLLEAVMKLIGYFNKHDQCDIPNDDSTEIDIEIDYIKHEITINSVQLFYFLIVSSQVSLNDNETDPLTIRTISLVIESLTTHDSNEGVFNRFINQILRMIFIWIFPNAFKVTSQTQLQPQHVVTIYQFFSSLRTIIGCIPKIMNLFRIEMKEEFKYFAFHEFTFSEEYPLTSPTIKVLKSFQRNMKSSNPIFID